jgi:hypothetical protein
MKVLHNRIVSLLLALVTLGGFAGVTLGQENEAPHVNYVSSDAVYLNAGRYAGLRIGATVEVTRGGRTIAVLEVTHVSSHSASCRVVEQTDEIRIGDAVTFDPAAASPPVATPAAGITTVPTSSGVGPTVNEVIGHVEFQSLWQKDLSDSDLSFLQPAVAARFRVRNVGGKGLEFRFRDRVRLYHRNMPAGPDIPENEWYHRLTEMALVYDRSGATIEWGVGRLIAPYMVGVGLVDGGYIAFRINRYLRAGAAGGLEPSPLDLNFDSSRQRVGGYLAVDLDSNREWRLTSSAALAGSYVSGTINREFVYLQNAFSMLKRFSLFQSAEIDLNRDWRREATGDDVTLTNFYFTANVEISRYAQVDFTYDSRKNVRVYETMATPDSLFDDGVFDGYGGGVSLRMPHGVTLGGRGGIRYHVDRRTNRYFSLFARGARLPWRGHSVWARYAYAETRSVTGHRPALAYRFPLGARLRMDATAGGYIYEQGTRVTSSYYAEAGAYYPRGRYFASGSYRQYFDGGLDSILLFAEIGLQL